MATLKVYRNSTRLNPVFEVNPPAGISFYSCWYEGTPERRTADIPVAPGTTSLKFFVDTDAPGEVWSDNNILRNSKLRFWANDLEPEAFNFTVPLVGGAGTDPNPNPNPTSGVTQIVAGSGISVSPADGQGVVTVTNTAQGGGGGGGTTIIIQGGNLPKPTTRAELQALADAAALTGSVIVLAPGTKVNVDQTIIFRQQHHGGEVWGMDGSMAQLNWTGPGGQDVVRAEGVDGTPNRGFYFCNFQIYGGGYDHDPAAACLRIRCPGGDNAAYYKPTLQNIYTSYAEYGFVFEGAVFEFSHFNLHAENHRNHGMVAVSLGGAIMSNAFGIAPNMSRNGGSGIFTGYSHNIIMGSFIQNSRYGVEAPDGLRVGAFNNGENTGESLFKLNSDGYGSVIMGNEMSTGFVGVNNFGLPSSGLSRYVLDAPPGVAAPSASDPKDCHVATYGGADGQPNIRVRK